MFFYILTFVSFPFSSFLHDDKGQLSLTKFNGLSINCEVHNLITMQGRPYWDCVLLLYHSYETG